jgi:hypothetical protein
MRFEQEPFDLSTSPEVLRLAEEVHASSKPRAFGATGKSLQCCCQRPFQSQAGSKSATCRHRMSPISVPLPVPGLTLVTRNLRHFQRFPGLRLYQQP